MTSVHREKSREGINKGAMRKEKKERGNEEEEAGTEKKHPRSPWHQRCMWLLEQVRGCRGRQHKLVRNCGNKETVRSCRKVENRSFSMQTQMSYSHIQHHGLKQLRTVWWWFQSVWKMTIKWSQRGEDHMALAVMLHRAEEDITVWKLKGKLCQRSLDALLVLLLWLRDGSAYGNIRLYIRALANWYQEELACFFLVQYTCTKTLQFFSSLI